MMNAPAHFIPDREPQTFYPLRSYLRVPSTSVAGEYISRLTAPGDLVIDPFAATPRIAQTAHSLGRKAIAVESNPLWSWIAYTMATLPGAAEINAALARLGDTIKDGAPLRTHIGQMYATLCANCKQETQVDYTLWQSDAGPYRRHYTCVHCGETRDDPVSEDDLKRAAKFESHGFHFHYAFERTVPAENLHAERIRKMLDLYTPRNLQALVTITQKLDALFRTDRERDLLLVLLLHLLDRGTSFYTDPAPTARADMKTHKQFVEFNLWREIESAAHILADMAAENKCSLVKATAEVIDAKDPAVFLGRGSAKALERTLPEQSAALVLGTPPVRRMGVWALSYFWGAWILGRSAVESLVVSLDPHKAEPLWDRRWYADLVAGTFDAATRLVRMDGHLAFLFQESWQEVIEALLLGAAGARLELDGLVFQPRRGDAPRREFDSVPGDYRLAFTRRKTSPLKILAEPQLADKMRTTALAGCREILNRRGEPLAFSWIHHAAYTRLYQEELLAQLMSSNPKVTPARFAFLAVREGLNEGYAHDLDHYTSSSECLWLRRAPAHAPIMDRVDDAVLEILTAKTRLPAEELENAIYRQFPGDLTPEAGLIELCARAYADSDGQVWMLRAEDLEEEKKSVLERLSILGERLEFHVGAAAPFDLIWEAEGETAHGFIWRPRVRWEDLAQTQITPTRGYLVLPEARVELAIERVRALPLQAEAFRDAGWDFVRAPFVDNLLGVENIERHDIMLITGLVPPVAGERTQLELF